MAGETSAGSKKWKTDLRNYLLTGLLVAAPLAATVFVIGILLNLADASLQLLPKGLRPEEIMHVRIPGLFGLILTFGFLVIVGFLARNYFGQRLVRFYERILQRIPVVGGVYSAAKQLAMAIFSSDEQKFSRVVLVQFPHPGMHTLAFVTAEDAGHLAKPHDRPCCSVFVPTTPNPTSGYFMVVPREDTIPTDLTIEEAFRVIVSAGLVGPHEKPKPIPDAAKE